MKQHSRALSLRIERDFRGGSLAPGQHVDLCIEIVAGAAPCLRVEFDAPWLSSPSPEGAVGNFPELWKYTVVEIFILGERGRYLELEFGPLGHYWLLELRAFRARLRTDIFCDYHAERRGDRWLGRGELALAELPAPLPELGGWRVSACAIWEEQAERVYAMAFPTLSEQPDFHQLAAFGAVLPAGAAASPS